MTDRVRQSPKVALPLVFTLLLAASAIAAGPTAREALAKAKPSARAWQADAILHQITSTELSADGTLTGEATSLWHFHFFSPSAKSSYTVIVGPTVVGVPGRVGLARPIDEDFVDSNRAAAEAKRDGFAPTGKIVMVLADAMWAGVKKPTLVWTIRDPADPTKVWYVDPKTGKVVGKKQPRPVGGAFIPHKVPHP
jgi:hypothetical protein